MGGIRLQYRMNRRDALKSITVFGSVALAGCSSVLNSGESGTVLGKIEVINSSFVSNRIRLMVERDDETLFDRNIGLTAIDAGDRAASTIIEPIWSETQGQYTVRAFHVDDSGDRETSSREYTFTRDDYNRYYGDSHRDPGCIGAIVKIGSRAETENAEIGISSIHMENPCGTPNSQ